MPSRKDGTRSFASTKRGPLGEARYVVWSAICSPTYFSMLRWRAWRNPKALSPCETIPSMPARGSRWRQIPLSSDALWQTGWPRVLILVEG
jgi:hypothetical protein